MSKVMNSNQTTKKVRTMPSKAWIPPGPFDASAAESDLRAACQKLTNRAGVGPTIERAVATLMTLGRAIHQRPPLHNPAFALVSKATCERELRNVAEKALSLAEAIEGLHEPTIIALADQHMHCSVRINLPPVLRQLADQAEHATVANQPPQAGRGARVRAPALMIARTAGRLYREITDKPPTFTTDPMTSERRGLWPTFLRAVFSALHYHAYGDRLMRTVAEEKAKSK